MLNNLHDALKRRRAGEKESGAAMIFALLILMVLVLLSVTMTVQATTSATSQREIALREAYIASAYSGLETAVYNANNSTDAKWLENRRGVAKALVGTPPANVSSINGLKWRIYTERVVTAGNQLSYYLYATGYIDALGVNEGITVRGIVNGIDVTEGSYNASGGIQYRLSVEGSWAHGLTGIKSINLLSNSKVYSYDSALSGFTPSGTSKVDTNFYTKGLMTIANANHGLKSGTISAYTTSNRCMPENTCDTAGIVLRELGFDVDLTEVTENVNSSCPNVSYPVWTASANGGMLNLPADTCVGGLVFDVDTKVPASFSKTNPLRVNVKGGNITVNPGVKVNNTNVPTALMVRSTGNGNISFEDGSKTNMFVSAPTATCLTKGTAVFFGGLSCSKISLEGNSIVYLDLSIKSDVFGSDRKIWNLSYVEEL